ncbi:MAG: FkbM family methyltransferase [Acidimicrobiia bacterium]|nr:FkbM family methyltransferase [Acidimicrobiia bacterium]
MSVRREHALVRRSASVAAAFLAAYENDDGDAEHDGEFALLARLAQVEPVVILDVGANVGHWTAAARRCFPNATIHAFEPAPPTFDRLQRRFAHDGGVHAHPVALGAGTGSARLGYDVAHTEVASLAVLPAGSETFDVAVRAGDDVLDEHAIERVHLLKVDAEGYDLEVLRGFVRAFARGAVDIVQFEVSPWNSVARVWVHDLVDALGEGWTTGRVFPQHVALAPYSPELERFQHRQNHVAVRADRPDLVVAVAGRRGHR